MPKLNEKSKIDIDLTPTWKLTTDDYNYIISRKVKRESGRIGLVVDGYYPTLEDAMESLLDKRIRESEAKSIRALTKLIKDSKEEIKGYYKGIKKK